MTNLPRSFSVLHRVIKQNFSSYSSRELNGRERWCPGRQERLSSGSPVRANGYLVFDYRSSVKREEGA